MKKLLFCIASLMLAFSAAAQTPDASAEKSDPNKVMYGGEVLSLTVAPTFKKGGFDKYCNWVLNRVRYPSELQGKPTKVEGTVIVKIIVETDGSVMVDEVLESPHEALTQEVLSVVNSSPKWTPGMLKDPATGENVPVRVAYKLPIAFKERDMALNRGETRGQMQRMNTNVRTYGSSN